MSIKSKMRSTNAMDKDGLKFLQDMLPASEKTVLYFHISYLCLAKFPELERIIRKNAGEAQEAFEASDDLLKECTKTSNNMVTILFPALEASVEKKEVGTVISHLGKARGWIQVMIKKADKMVKEYMDLTRLVAAATSDVHKVKVELQRERTELREELKESEGNIKQWEKTAENKRQSLRECRSALNAAVQNVHNIGNEIAERNRKFEIVAATVPLVGLIIYASQRAANEPEDNRRLEVARNKVREQESREDTLEEELERAEREVEHWKYRFTEISNEFGDIPDPVFLSEALPNLTKVQETFVKLKSFWEKVEVLVQHLEQKTFVGEDLIEALDTFKEEFLDSIKTAALVWADFEDICSLVSATFNERNKDAYKFLDSCPSSLSSEEWQRQYNELKTRLQNVPAKLM